ncbi:MAG: hypothetical protein ABFC90_01950 [Bacteroidales bacterium]|nr:hypothetical protein [Bacteroidales bacterium]MCK9311033.1 hypothetical protein [Bacteroidales bacterium]
MSVSSELYFNGYCALELDNGFDSYIVSRIFTVDNFYEEKIGDEINAITRFGFRESVKVCKDRLRIFGVTEEKSASDFYNLMGKMHDEGYVFVNHDNITYKIYLDLIKDIIDNKLTGGNPFSLDFKDSLIGNECYFGGLIGALETDNWLYSMLSVIGDDALIDYDLSAVIENGCISSDPKMLVLNPKIIVLTEGTTDTEFIKGGFMHFYPHLLPFYHFIDYENIKPNSGASALAHSIKSFAGSGIDNLIIALFDNDTTGHKESDTLNTIELPKTMKIQHYPDIDILRNYPSISPDGSLQNVNVNSLAGSLEMYLGVDLLKDDNGSLYPIIWSSYEFSLEKYQGGLSKLAKEKIDKSFRIKLKSSKVIWPEFECLLNMIINAWV